MTSTPTFTFPEAAAQLPAYLNRAGRYDVRFARSEDELDRVLRLRYQVFNLELDEGLADSAVHGRDEDDFDRRFHHLIIEDRSGGEIVGTYRMQTAEMARRGGYYSAGLFDVEALPGEVLESAVEIGRACVAKSHRNGRVLHLLWRGLAAYLAWNGKRRLFGCCSLTSQDEALGGATHRYLVEAGAVHRSLRVNPRPESALASVSPLLQVPPAPVHIPALFKAYLDIGATVLGPPAIDREFRTIDWLVLLDVRELAPPVLRSLFR